HDEQPRGEHGSAMPASDVEANTRRRGGSRSASFGLKMAYFPPSGNGKGYNRSSTSDAAAWRETTMPQRPMAYRKDYTTAGNSAAEDGQTSGGMSSLDVEPPASEQGVAESCGNSQESEAGAVGTTNQKQNRVTAGGSYYPSSGATGSTTGANNSMRGGREHQPYSAPGQTDYYGSKMGGLGKCGSSYAHSSGKGAGEPRYRGKSLGSTNGSGGGVGAQQHGWNSAGKAGTTSKQFSGSWSTTATRGAILHGSVSAWSHANVTVVQEAHKGREQPGLRAMSRYADHMQNPRVLGQEHGTAEVDEGEGPATADAASLVESMPVGAGVHRERRADWSSAWNRRRT
ncbi:unnamed protein product, partial [Amoebophrya sp. A25]